MFGGFGEPDLAKPPMDRDGFRALVSRLTAAVVGQPLDAALGERLNRDHPPGSETYEAIFAACRAGVAAGWICNREADGIRYGRVINAGPATHGFSVDVVEMRECAGPRHVHPNGEIDLVMPLEGPAEFDGRPGGWEGLCAWQRSPSRRARRPGALVLLSPSGRRNPVHRQARFGDAMTDLLPNYSGGRWVDGGATAPLCAIR